MPRAAVFGSTLIGAAIAILNYFAPKGVFEFLLASSGAIALLVYMVIAISQLRAPPPGAGEHRAEVPHVAVPVPDLGGDHFHWGRWRS